MASGGGDGPWNKMWCTKDDVMQDLALTTGGGLEVDDQFLVYGERPPPRVEYQIDDEMKLLFGGEAGNASHDQGFSKPDLKGIMSMIRMVESEDDEEHPNTRQTAQPTEVIVISKLNPNVKEFVPKSVNVRQQHTTQSSGADQKVKKTITILSNTTSPHISSPTQSHSKTTQNSSTPTQHINSPTKISSSPSRNTSVPNQSASTPTESTRNSTTPTQNRTTPIQSKTTPTESRITPTQSQTTPTESRITPTQSSITSQSSTTPAQSTTTPAQSSSSPTQSSSKTPRSNTPAQSSCTEAEIQSLKDKIVSAPGKDSYEYRREKNAAIATLLRHCTMLPVKTAKEKPIKLYTPEFFERCKAADFEGTFGSNSTVISKNEDGPEAIIKTDIKDLISEDIISKDRKDIISKDTKYPISKVTKDIISKEKEVKDEEHTQLTPEIEDNLKIDDAEAEPIPSYEEIEQQKSIAKVTEWLKGPVAPKKEMPKPVLLAGPTAYKRKEVMSPMSSTSSIVIDKKISRHESKAFVPSSYATELRQKYEKNKTVETKSLNIWANLEDQLKKKDEEVKKKRGQE